MSNAQQPKPTVLCIYGSPRSGGNTDVIMDAFVSGVEEAGCLAKRIYLRDLTISPCKELYKCRKFGECAINDDMTPLYAEILSAEGIALASPVMFYAVSATAKAFIDRCQALWCAKYMLKKSLRPEGKPGPKGVILAAGGSSGQKLFDGIRMTFKYFLDAIDGEFWGELYVRNVDVRGDAKKRPEELDQARALGAKLAGELLSEGGTEE